MDTQINDSEIIAISKLFQRGKTVIPSEIRTLLNIKDGDKIVWRRDKVGSMIYIQIIGEKLVRYTPSRENPQLK